MCKVLGEQNLFADEFVQLKKTTAHVHPGFLTYLLDKYYSTNGNYRLPDIIPFLKAVNLKSRSGLFMNPWMNKPYKNENSCTRTIEHFRQPRRFGCFFERHFKTDCDAEGYCPYHPDSPNGIQNKCNLRYGVIWKRENPDVLSPFSYASNYIEVVTEQLLGGSPIKLKPLLAVFYKGEEYGDDLIRKFRGDFHIEDREICLFVV